MNEKYNFLLPSSGSTLKKLAFLADNPLGGGGGWSDPRQLRNVFFYLKKGSGTF